MHHPSRISRALGRTRGALTGAARQLRSILPGQFQGFLLGAPTLSGVTVTPQTALGLTAFFAGVNVISFDVAKLPLGLYRRQRNGGQTLVTNDPRQLICRSKWNAESNALRGRQHSMGRVLGWGNDYSLILRDPSGMPTGLQPFNPATFLPMRDEASGGLYYLDLDTNQKHRPENILHIAGLGFDGIMGYCPVTLHRQAIGLGMAAEQFGASLFGNGAIPKGVLKTPKKLSEQAARRLRDTFYNTHGGPQNANRTAVLEDGLEWVSTQINPDDAQFLATRQFQVVEIGRMLNIPPHKLQDYTQSHRSSTEEGNLDYLTGNLQGWLSAIEAELNSKLLFPNESERYFFSHDMSALLRGNMMARSSYYKTLFSVGSITPNEIRTKENLNPSKEPNADKSYLQAQCVPLDAAGDAMAAKAAGGPVPGPPAAEPDGDEPPKGDGGRGRPPPRRFNHNHGHDGKFSGGSGATIGGAASIAKGEGVAVEAEGHDTLSAKLGEAKAAQVPAAYQSSSKKIVINEENSYWKDPAGTMARANKSNWFSSDSPDHIIHHEIGHALHDRADPANYHSLKSMSFNEQQKGMIARDVSRYASSKPLEMVAEVYAGAKAGRSFPPKVMDFYHKLKGPDL